MQAICLKCRNPFETESAGDEPVTCPSCGHSIDARATRHHDPRAAEELLPLVYHELRKLAGQKLAREKPGQTLDATALVHEAYLRLVGDDTRKQWDGRGHFFSAAAEAMRRILVENARRKRRIRHGGGFERVDLGDVAPAMAGPADDVLAVDEAIDSLAESDPVAARLVKLHFFAGMTIEDAASLLGMSDRTAFRTWAFARAWLYRKMLDGEQE